MGGMRGRRACDARAATSLRVSGRDAGREVPGGPSRGGGGGCSEGEESSDPTQHAEGRTGDCPGPAKKQQRDGMSHRGEEFV